VTERLGDLAKGVNVDALREDKQLRARAAAAMEEAREAVSRLVTAETRRQIRVRDDEEEGEAV
jgi:selenocysteine lyase/cysteine desulfurase